MDKLDGLIVILGSPNNDAGDLSSIARERCLLAVDLHRQHPTYAILPTGGFGPHFNRTQRPHGAYIREHLIHLGVPAEIILDPVQSSNTIEDAVMVAPLFTVLMPHDTIVVTSEYHEARARFLFDRHVGKAIRW